MMNVVSVGAYVRVCPNGGRILSDIADHVSSK